MEGVCRSGSDLAQDGFEFRPRGLDRVEVRRVAREIEQARAGSFDELTNDRSLVSSEIVHQDDIAVAQCGHETLLDIGLEGERVHRTAKHHRRDDPFKPERGDDRHTVAPILRHGIDRALTARRTRVTARHRKMHARLVQKD